MLALERHKVVAMTNPGYSMSVAGSSRQIYQFLKNFGFASVRGIHSCCSKVRDSYGRVDFPSTPHHR
ncbi:hypothetical protein D3C77_54220 [compost metagenome]